MRGQILHARTFSSEVIDLANDEISVTGIFLIDKVH